MIKCTENSLNFAIQPFYWAKRFNLTCQNSMDNFYVLILPNVNQQQTYKLVIINPWLNILSIFCICLFSLYSTTFQLALDLKESYPWRQSKSSSGASWTDLLECCILYPHGSRSWDKKSGKDGIRTKWPIRPELTWFPLHEVTSTSTSPRMGC